jgi:hypothetical protein
MKKFLLNLVKKYLLKKVPFYPGDLVKLEHGSIIYEVTGIYYSSELVPVLFIRDADGRLYGQDPALYVKYNGIAHI